MVAHVLNVLEPLLKKLYDAYMENSLILYLKNFWTIRRRHYEITQNKKYPQLLCDAYLTNVELKNVEMDGYLAATVQFGFIVLFSVAFPVAPLLALVHNILQRKIDTINIVTRYKRPFSHQGKNIVLKYSKKYRYLGKMDHWIILYRSSHECVYNCVYFYIF